MADNEKTTDIYWKLFGILGLGIGVGFILSKWSKGKNDKNVVNHMTAKAELSKIVADGQPKIDPNVQTTDVADNKVLTGQMRSSAFKEDSKQDVAAPTIIEVVEKKQEPVNDSGSQQQAQIPPNAFVGSIGNGNGFEETDVIFSLGNQIAKQARIVSGNYVGVDKAGNNLGTVNFNHMQKLGIITAKDNNGVFFKVAPEWKKYAFISYDRIYKLT